MTCIVPRCDVPPVPGSPFCGDHAAAPAGRRGGWLSAHRRKQRQGEGRVLEASNVARRLWIGSVPPFDRDLPEFNVLVLCAYEHQPSELGFKGQVVRCPIDDGSPSPREVKLALAAGREVARALVEGKTVLSTCHAGRNRSALVAGLGLGLVTRMTADQIVELIRARRSPSALSNPHFVKILRAYVPGPRRPATATAPA